MSKIIGLTGPIAAGKNEVAKILANNGAFVIDVDQEANALTGLSRAEPPPGSDSAELLPWAKGVAESWRTLSLSGETVPEWAVPME